MNEANNNAAAAVAHRQRKHHSVSKTKQHTIRNGPTEEATLKQPLKQATKQSGRELARWCHNNTAQDPLESKYVAHAPCSQLYAP